MLEAVYTQAPRPVRAVFFFGQGRFRRVRDGALASDLDHKRDVSIEMESYTEQSPDTGSTFISYQYVQPRVTVLRENGKTLASSEHALRITGRRRPNLVVYVVR